MDYFLKLSMQIGDDDDFVGNVNGDDDEENVMLAVKLKVAKLVFGLLDWAELYSSVIHCSSSINIIYHEDDCDDDDDDDDDEDDITDTRDVHSNQQWPTQGSCYRTSGMSLTKCRMVRHVAVFMKIHPSFFSRK